MKQEIVLRPATADDADTLLSWRNNAETREASHNARPVKRDEHVAWLRRTLADSNRKLFVAEKNTLPVGTVRADFLEGVWELSWTVSPYARGQGVAKKIVAALASQISEPIRAEVKKGNVASSRIAEYAGMKFEMEDNGVLHYKRGAAQEHDT